LRRKGTDHPIGLGRMNRAIHEQRVVHYEGHVQGVGFRHTVTLLAKPYSVNGYVQNLEDGRVKLVMEGFPAELERLERDIEERLGQFLRHRTAETRTATGEYVRFEVKY
jgi:acylphosphatase